MVETGQLPLFETTAAKRRVLFKLYAASMAMGICLICTYRASYTPKSAGRYSWIGLFIAELWFTLYWITTQLVRWNPVTHHTFKQRLSHRFEKVLPGVDIFVCTADPVIEPPIMVINTVLSMMAYDYPQEKLCIYVSDDGGSELMFYALLEASRFCKYWIPFCKRYKIEPRSPSAYFLHPSHHQNEWSSMKNNYEEMRIRIDNTTRLGKVTDEQRNEHKGFQEWDIGSRKSDHQAILQILINQGDPMSRDTDGKSLPGLVYMAREKRPKWHHNFKAGAMNALIRVSSRISNHPIILNVDCDMYSNNSQSIRDAMCFFMDEEKSHQIAFVQFPQNFHNLTRNDLYSNSLMVISEVEMGGFDSHGGCLYYGSGCFHRRDALCGRKYTHNTRIKKNHKKIIEDIDVVEKECRILASCRYEHNNTEWGKEVGLMYGCPGEDIITGMTIQCRGWRSIHFNPERKGFLGLAPTTLLQTLIQSKRWAEGDLQTLLSRYCPLIYGHTRIPLKLQISYCCYFFWALNCCATLYYVTVPCYGLLAGISLFPEISNFWFLPFAYVFLGKYGYSFGEFYLLGGSVKSWWNDQRMWLYRTVTSYLFAFCNVLLELMGITTTSFIVTSKVSEEEASVRYKNEIMEFGATSPSPMFYILSTLAMLHVFSFLIGIKWVIVDSDAHCLSELAVQMILCGLVILINLPIYQGLFFRKDNGRMPSSVAYHSTVLAIVLCTLAYI